MEVVVVHVSMDRCDRGLSHRDTLFLQRLKKLQGLV